MIQRPKELVPLKLNQQLKRLGTATLSEMVGRRRLDVIDEILSSSITESKLVRFLELRYGTQILANKDIRAELILRLPATYQIFILQGTLGKDAPLTEMNIRQLLKIKWGRKSVYAQRILAIFDLEDDYLPPVYIKHPSSEIITPEISLYPYQVRLKNRLVRSLVSGNERILLHMPTGSGKTRTSIEAISDYWRSIADRSGCIVWLAHSEELCEQAVETFKKIWTERGDEPLEIFRLWGDHENPDFKNKNGFVVASLQRLHAMRTTANNEIFKAISILKSKCKLIVIDEAHKAVAPTYKASTEFIANLEKTKIIGLTATPGRGGEEGETQELVEFFHRNKITLTDEYGEVIANPIKFLQDNRYLSKVVRREIASDVKIDLNEKERKFVATFLDIPTSVLNKLANDASRNALILGEIAALCSGGRNVIVFALSVDHAHLVTELLNLRGIEARCVDGACTSYDRHRYIDAYKVGEVKVLVNYGVLTTGFDAPNTNAVLIARPTGSLVLYSQMIGRGIRGPRMGGNDECILVDIKDNLGGFPDEKNAFIYFNDEWS